MARKAKCWRWVTGSHGAKVTAFERVPGGSLYIGVPPVGGGYDRISLGHSDREIAMSEAAKVAARRQAGGSYAGPLTVAGLFALYLKAVSDSQSAEHSVNTMRSAALWTRWLGPDFKVERFGPSEWGVIHPPAVVRGIERARSDGS